MGNGAVIRDNLDDLDAGELALFDAAGVCPAGRSQFVKDEYLNLATRTIEGRDLAIYYDFETDFGDFAITFADSQTTKFHQTPTGRFNELQAAFDSGVLPPCLALDGFGDLLGVNGFFERKDSLRIRYSNGNYGASVSALRIGDFTHSKMKLSDGTMWHIPSMTTVNASLYYKFDVKDKKARVKFAVKNAKDERAPLADGYNGFYSDVHSDLGRNYYIDFRLDF
jgi:outer membrane receptor protein involved in Fe transport